MTPVTIQGREGTSTILVGENFDRLAARIPLSQSVLITDPNLWRIYGERFPPCEVIRIGTGEANKTLATVAAIFERLVAMEAQRSTFIVGIGGGIVCDIAGFVAATYLRGVECALVPTSLLAQVDASVGGKNGVNFGGYKNMVGTFRQPAFVLCDPQMLRSLPERELTSGFAEIVKHAAIADAALFAHLESRWQAAMALDPEVINHLVARCVAIKAAVVRRDEHEQGERRKLNFGHTFGHALEKTTGALHGEAVAVGMLIAAALSVQRGLLPPAAYQRLQALLAKLGLPTRMNFNREAVLEALGKDKKRTGDSVHFVLLRDIGRSVVTEITLPELGAALDLV
jgi:3-dehydroquinate synthase